MKKINKLSASFAIIILLLVITNVSFRAYGSEIVPKVEKIYEEYADIHEGQIQVMDFLVKGECKFQYRIWLCDRKTGIWRDLTNGYSKAVSGNKVYSVSIPKLSEGDYTVSIWVKRDGKKPKDKRGFDSYLGHSIKCLKNDIKTNTYINLRNNYLSGENIKIGNDKKENILYSCSLYDVLKKKNIKEFGSYRTSHSWNLKDGVYLVTANIKILEKTYLNEKNNTYNYDEIETKIQKLILVGNPYKLNNIKRSIYNVNKVSLVVGNKSENEIIYIKSRPDNKSSNVGHIYGSLQEIKILKKVGNYYYIETMDYSTLRTIRGYVLISQVKVVVPVKPYLIKVSLDKQKVLIFKNGKIDRIFICSTGKNTTPTPKGIYLIGDRGEGFNTGIDKTNICYNWVRFNHDFLFHSLIYNKYGQLIQSEARKLGHNVSHGCIRLKIEDAKWIYNNISRGTIVSVEK